MLTKADKKWLRDMVREIVEEIVGEQPVQLGGYDGVTKYEDDLDESEYGRRKPRRIGFTARPGGNMK